MGSVSAFHAAAANKDYTNVPPVKQGAGMIKPRAVQQHRAGAGCPDTHQENEVKTCTTYRKLKVHASVSSKQQGH